MHLNLRVDLFLVATMRFLFVFLYSGVAMNATKTNYWPNAMPISTLHFNIITIIFETNRFMHFEIQIYVLQGNSDPQIELAQMHLQDIALQREVLIMITFFHFCNDIMQESNNIYDFVFRRYKRNKIC